MAKQLNQTDASLDDYAVKVFKPEDAILLEIRRVAQENGLRDIHVGSMDGLHLEVLTRAFKVKKAVEIGTLAGYSGVTICRGLLPEGKLYTFESVSKHAEIAKKNFKAAGFEKSVEVFVGPALENLDRVSALGPFDLVFIDADKSNYVNYLKWAAKNLAVGGVVLADNTFAWGRIAQEKFEDAKDERNVRALALFNETLANHPQFRSTILPTGEGLTMGVKIR